MSALTVVKVGGSLCADPARLAGLLATLADGIYGACVIVPGGGVFADAVRVAQAREGFGDATAHRLALDAMGRMAETFCAIEPRLVRFQDPGRALSSPLPTLADARPALPRRAAGEEAATLVWDPALLKSGHPDIPETWDVTSDSLALWLARETGAVRCVLVKSAAVPPGRSALDLSRLGLVDAAFPDFAARYTGTIEFRGPNGAVILSDRVAA